MRVQDIFVFAFNALRDRKLRTTLTLLGIAIGPAAIVALIGASEGYSEGMTAQFEKIGANTMQIMPMGRGATLSAQDVNSIQSIPHVQYVIPFYRTNVELKYGGTSISTTIIALDTSLLQILFPTIEVSEGKIPQASEFTSAVIGYSVANPSDPEILPLSINQIATASRQAGGAFGQGFFINPDTTSRSFLVTGVLTEFGQGLFINPDDSIFVPLEAGRLIIRSNYYSGLYVIASNADTVGQVQEAISDMYENVRIMTISTILSTIQGVTESTTTMLASIASISVAVAFMGIMTTMFTSVNERTREIGVTKALGYSSTTVMLFFLTEAILTGLLGGVIGSISGALLSNFATSFLGGGIGFGVPRGGPPGGQQATSTLTVTPIITPELILAAILMATIVGALAGIIPAWRASRLTPVEALRHE